LENTTTTYKQTDVRLKRTIRQMCDKSSLRFSLCGCGVFQQQQNRNLLITNPTANEAKSVHVTFTLNKMTCPPVKLNNDYLPQADEVKYLGIHLDRRLTWRKHIFTKRKQLDLKLRNLYWIIGRKSQLSLENKLLFTKLS
jgi:hypothetical protein